MRQTIDRRTTFGVSRNLLDIRRLHAAIPRFARIHNNVGTGLTGAETHVRFDLDAFRTLQRLSKLFQQFDRAASFAIRILADQNVRICH